MSEFPIRIFVTLRGVCDTETIEAESMEEAMRKAREIDVTEYTFDLPEEGDTVDTLAEADCIIDIEYPDTDDGRENVTVHHRAAGEPYSWTAADIVKRLAALKDQPDSIRALEDDELIEDAHRACFGDEDEPVPAHGPAYDHANDTVDALVQAESFIRGFEDDELQTGVADMLAGLNAAIARERAKPDMLDALKALTGTIWFTESDHCQVEVRDVKRVHDAALAIIASAEGRASADYPTWAKSLTERQMTAVLYEMRDRGAAVAFYDAGELATMFDDGREWKSFMDEHRDGIEEVMCEAAREYAERENPDTAEDDED